MPKKDQARPVISSPVGPIKSSRGPDLVRSDRFHIVHGIDDCQDLSPTEAASSATASMAAKTTKRVSASFPDQERPAASPTVGSSSVNATNPAMAPSAPSSSRFLRRPSFPSFGRSKSSKSLLPTSSTTWLLPTRARQAENVPPTPSFTPPVVATPQLPQQASKLPKSRTMNVLHDLRNSISRQNLSSRFNDSRRTPAPSQMPQHPRPPPIPRMPPPSWHPAPSQMPQMPRTPALPQTSASSRIAAPPHIPGLPHTSAQLDTPWPSQQHAIRRKPVPSHAPGPSHPPVASRNSGPMQMAQPPSQVPSMPSSKAPSPPQTNPPSAAPKPRSAFSVDSSRSATPEPDRSQVLAAQPMEYWTGRFSRLNDMYLAEDRGPEILLALRSGLLSQHRQHINPQSVDEDDARHLHIFAQLDFLCATQDAKQSLWEFQQVFARRFNRAILLPEGGSMGGQHQPPVSRLPGSRHSSVEGRGGGPSRPPSSQTMGSNAGGPHGTP